MTQLSPTALEAAAKATCESMHGNCNNAEYISDYYTQHATAAITAYLAQAEKEGWVMVPKVANDKMVCAALDDFEKRAGRQRLTHIYAAMLAAAQNGGDLPAPPMGK